MFLFFGSWIINKQPTEIDDGIFKRVSIVLNELLNHKQCRHLTISEFLIVARSLP